MDGWCCYLIVQVYHKDRWRPRHLRLEPRTECVFAWSTPSSLWSLVLLSLPPAAIHCLRQKKNPTVDKSSCYSLVLESHIKLQLFVLEITFLTNRSNQCQDLFKFCKVWYLTHVEVSVQVLSMCVGEAVGWDALLLDGLLSSIRVDGGHYDDPGVVD